MRPRCIAADFDYTLAHFSDPVEQGLFEIFRRRGVSEAVIVSSYKRTVARSFNIDNFTGEIESSGLALFDKETIGAEFDAWLNGALSLYQDSMQFLKKWWGQIPLGIVTFGDQVYQRQKIHAARIPYDDLRVITPPMRKIEALEEFLSRYGAPVLFLEDKPDELDIALSRLGTQNVITALVLREDSPYNGKQSRCEHIQVRSLEEVSRLIEEAG